MDDFSAGRSRGANHGLPTTAETGNSRFMEGFNAGAPRSPPVINPYPLPDFGQRNQGDQQPSSNEPFSLRGSVKTFAGLGFVACLAFAFFTHRIGFVQAGLLGLAGGALAGAGMYVAVMILTGVFWLLGWAIRIGLVLAAVWFVFYLFAR